MMNKKTIAAGLALLPFASVAFASGPAVTIVSRGHDVRLILTDIFAQAKKSCVIQANLHMSLYLSLENTDFDQALSIICKQAGLQSTIEDGVYYIVRPKQVEVVAPMRVVKAAITPLPPVRTAALIEQPVTWTNPQVLRKRVTTHMMKADIRSVFSSFSEQSGVRIVVDRSVPYYRLDAFLNHTSLKFALDTITRAARLNYRLTSQDSILISRRS